MQHFKTYVLQLGVRIRHTLLHTKRHWPDTFF